MMMMTMMRRVACSCPAKPRRMQGVWSWGGSTLLALSTEHQGDHRGGGGEDDHDGADGGGGGEDDHDGGGADDDDGCGKDDGDGCGEDEDDQYVH